MTQEILISKEARRLLSVITTDFRVLEDGLWTDREDRWRDAIGNMVGNTPEQFKEALDALYQAARPNQVSDYLHTLEMMGNSLASPLSLTGELPRNSRRILGLAVWNAIGRPKAHYYDLPLLNQTALQIVDQMHLPTNSRGEVNLSEPAQFHPAYFLTHLLANQVDISPHTPLP